MAALSDNRTTPTTVLIDDLPPVCDHGTSKEPLHYCRGSDWLASSIIIPQRWRNNPSRDLSLDSHGALPATLIKTPAKPTRPLRAYLFSSKRRDRVLAAG